MEKKQLHVDLIHNKQTQKKKEEECVVDAEIQTYGLSLNKYFNHWPTSHVLTIAVLTFNQLTEKEKNKLAIPRDPYM